MQLRVAGVNKVRAKGRIYYYHRKSGTRLQSEPGTLAFAQEVAVLDGMAPAILGPRQGSLSALIAAYKIAPEFTDLAPQTKLDYERVFDWLKPNGPKPVMDLTTAIVLALRDRAYAQRKRRFANYVVAVLSLLLKWGSGREWVKTNVASGVPMIKRPKSMAPANRPWTVAEFQTVFAAASAEMRPPMVLGLFLREGDVIRAPWSIYDGSAISSKQGKTGDIVCTPVPKFVRIVLDEAPKLSPVIVVGKRGRPYQTVSGFRAMFFKFLRKLASDGKIDKGLTFHGLRHSMGTWLADEAVDIRGIQSVLGHRTPAMAGHYSKDADSRRAAVAAIEKLERKKIRLAKPAAKPRKAR